MRVTGAIQLPKPVSGKIIDDLTFPNPFEPDSVFKAFFETPNLLIVPRGYPVDLTDATKSFISPSASFILASGYELREYQDTPIKDMVEYLTSLEFGQCLLSAATGSGKTYTLAYVLAKLGVKTLILSHLSMLGTQMMNELSSNLDNPNIGMISSDMIGEELPDIGISSFKLLECNPDLLKYISNHYGMVVVDEAENAVSTSRLKILFSLKPRYQLYLTATPTKELMRQTAAVRYLYGDKVFYMNPPNDQKIHSKHVMVDYRGLSWDSPNNTNLYKTSLGRFFLRSKIIPDIITTCRELKDAGVQGTFWIVADLNKVQDHIISLAVKAGLRVDVIRGKVSGKTRAKILDLISRGELDILVGSAPLSAGLSIPQLSVGFRVMPNSSSEELLEQQRGRLNRPADFKSYQYPIWIDLAISGSLLYNAKKRFNTYKGTTYGVKMVKSNELTQSILREIKK
jgi:superfamily II DNA or RNA helicase